MLKKWSRPAKASAEKPESPTSLSGGDDPPGEVERRFVDEVERLDLGGRLEQLPSPRWRRHREAHDLNGAGRTGERPREGAGRIDRFVGQLEPAADLVEHHTADVGLSDHRAAVADTDGADDHDDREHRVT